jgi:hypothetical protein
LGGPAIMRRPLWGPHMSLLLLLYDHHCFVPGDLRFTKAKKMTGREMAVYLAVAARSAAVCARVAAPVPLSRARPRRCAAASGTARASAPGSARADAAITGGVRG